MSGPVRRVVLATHNPHKVEEFQGIVAATRPDLEVVGYDGPEPVEDGVTFAQNALIKARAAAAHTGLPALADDSGICVDVLGGAPGVFSAYWAGHAKDAAANLALLLDQLSDVADPHRTAQFRSTIALVVPGGAEHVVEGVWPGRLATAPARSSRWRRCWRRCSPLGLGPHDARHGMRTGLIPDWGQASAARRRRA